MASKICLARLTSWETTNTPIGSSNKRASVVKLCKNIPDEGNLCRECSERPIEGKYQTRMCHGLLTEPPPDGSHVYGSLWYWDQVNRYGEPFDKGWLLQAHKAQCIAEGRCKAAGFVPWRVQRATEEQIKEMKGRKKTLPQVEKPQNTLMKHIPVIDTFYEETAKEPEKLPTDSVGITKKVLDEKEGPVWVTETGWVFAVGSTGDPTKLLRKISSES